MTRQIMVFLLGCDTLFCFRSSQHDKNKHRHKRQYLTHSITEQLETICADSSDSRLPGNVPWDTDILYLPTGSKIYLYLHYVGDIFTSYGYFQILTELTHCR